jgi:hypothetical protein
MLDANGPTRKICHLFRYTSQTAHIYEPVVCLPYLAGTADERQYKVMSDREQWFRVVMSQDEVARLITPDSTATIPLPQAISDGLSFKLGLRSKI